MFGGMGWTELIVIGAAALLLFGPKRLPELAKNLGKGIRDFKKALDGTAEEEPKEKISSPGETVTPPTKDSSKDTIHQFKPPKSS